MKSDYLTENNRQIFNREMLGLFPSKEITEFKPGVSALLVLDMQKVFLEEKSHAFVPGSRTILPLIAQLMDTYLQNNFLVILTKHVNTKEDAGVQPALEWNYCSVAQQP